jgi:hypothetical protein
MIQSNVLLSLLLFNSKFEFSKNIFSIIINLEKDLEKSNDDIIVLSRYFSKILINGKSLDDLQIDFQSACSNPSKFFSSISFYKKEVENALNKNDSEFNNNNFNYDDQLPPLVSIQKLVTLMKRSYDNNIDPNINDYLQTSLPMLFLISIKVCNIKMSTIFNTEKFFKNTTLGFKLKNIFLYFKKNIKTSIEGTYTQKFFFF